ncbi:unnamed protein product [Paramecium sonneborni]|uniref:Uncharacterized protein n=1 Tax=Paramecium sonneborni TaxID=65129 RepID=A0A8S1KUP2_9CILI|nr:unnamed protein product [Paramecium sonneborni]
MQTNPNQINYNVTKSKIHNYDNKKDFQDSFFRITNTKPDNKNFHIFFILIDFPQCYNKEKIEENNSGILQGQIINYVIEHQQALNNNQKFIFHKRNFQTQYIEEDFIQQIVQLFNKLLEGEKSSILLQNANLCYYQIIQNINSSISEFNSNFEQQKKKEDFKVTLIGITTEFDLKLIDSKYFQSFQSFTLMIQQPNQQCSIKKQEIQDLIMQDQYFLKINLNENLNKITNQINHLYRYFVKTKIKSFKPKLIILLLEISDNFDFETYYLQKLVKQLEKISQNSLIVIPFLNQVKCVSIYEKYLKSIITLSNAFLDYSYRRKNNDFQLCEEICAHQYKEYSQYFSQTQKEDQLFNLQFLSLKVIKKQYESNNMEIEQELKKQIQPNLINPQQQKSQLDNQNKPFEFNLIGILNAQNQIELKKLYEKTSKLPINISTVQYFIFYNNNSFIICIVNKQNQLFYKRHFYQKQTEQQIVDSIYLDKYRYEINKEQRSSFLLDENFFYEFNVACQQFLIKDSWQKQYYVQVRKFDLNDEKLPDIICNYENVDQNKLIKQINFTVTCLKKNQFILLGGFYLKPTTDSNKISNNFSVGSQSIIVEIDQENKLKIAENRGKLKEFEFPIALNINDQSFLYFDAQTQYLAAPINSQIKKITIFGQRQDLISENCKNINQKEYDFYQIKSKLFRSNHLNSKLIQKINKSNYLEYYIVVQEFIEDNLKKLDQQDIIDVKNLSKQLQLQAHRFHFIFDKAKSTLDIQVESSQCIIGQFEKQSSLRNACLYTNWLEDRNNQYIFNYNRHQNLYLLYFNDKIKMNIRKFIFEDTNEQNDNYDFDEVILNDLENEQIWIVRKNNHQDYITLDLFESDWINLQDVKDSVEDSITKVSMNFIYSITQTSEDFCLIGLEVKWELEDGQRCPYLIVCTNNCIYDISIKMIRKSKWDNILRYKPNTWIKEPLQFQESPIHKQRQVQFNLNMSIPTIIASLKNGDLLVFYTYCNVKKESYKLYELEIQYLILKDLNQSNNDQIQSEDLDHQRKFYFKTIKYNSNQEVNLARINIVLLGNNEFEFEFSVIVEESDSKLYKVFSGNEQKNVKQYITELKQCKILNDTAPLKNQCLIIDQGNQVYHMK